MQAHLRPPRAYFSIIKRARGDIQKLLASFVLLRYCVGSCGSYRGILDPTCEKPLFQCIKNEDPTGPTVGFRTKRLQEVVDAEGGRINH